MRYRSLPLAALALSSLTLAGCGNEPTQPSGAAEPRPTGPGAQPELTATVLTTVPFHQISTQFGPPCAVTPDNQAYCWSNGADAAAVPVPGNKLFRSVSVGGDGFACGIIRPGDVALLLGAQSERPAWRWYD